jgi:hypothetical protein
MDDADGGTIACQIDVVEQRENVPASRIAAPQGRELQLGHLGATERVSQRRLDVGFGDVHGGQRVYRLVRVEQILAGVSRFVHHHDGRDRGHRASMQPSGARAATQPCVAEQPQSLAQTEQRRIGDLVGAIQEYSATPIVDATQIYTPSSREIEMVNGTFAGPGGRRRGTNGEQSEETEANSRAPDRSR